MDFAGYNWWNIAAQLAILAVAVALAIASGQMIRRRGRRG
jgi:hypothetical protein